jgi:hypothetical protein
VGTSSVSIKLPSPFLIVSEHADSAFEATSLPKLASGASPSVSSKTSIFAFVADVAIALRLRSVDTSSKLTLMPLY